MASNFITDAIDIVAGSFPGVAFQREHIAAWRIGVTDEIGRLSRPEWPRWPEVVTTAARRYSQRCTSPRPRLAEFLAEIREVHSDVATRERESKRTAPQFQIASDEKPVDPERIREARRNLFGYRPKFVEPHVVDVEARRRDAIRRIGGGT